MASAVGAEVDAEAVDRKEPQSCDEENTRLRELFGLRALSRPPFLLRNLSYVRDLKRAGPHGFDMRWVRMSGGSSDRRILLSVSVAYCALLDLDWDRFVPKVDEDEADRDTENKAWKNKKGVKQKKGKKKDKKVELGDIDIWLRLWLVLEDGDHYRTAAGVKEVKIDTLSVENDIADGVDHEGTIADFSFDLGGVLAMATAISLPTRVFLRLELLDQMRDGPLMTSELCIFDAYRERSWIPSIAVQLPLKKAAYSKRMEEVKKRVREAKKRKEEEEKRRQENEAHSVMREKTMKATALRENATVGAAMIVHVDSDDEERHNYLDQEDWDTLTDTPVMKSFVSLKISGQPNVGSLKSRQDGLPVRRESDVLPAARIDLTYTSAERPRWEGIVRHDFRCPFCLRNNSCLRALWTHLSIDHEKAEYSVRAAQNDQSLKYGESRRVNLQVSFKAGNYNLDPPTSPAADDPSPHKDLSIVDDGLQHSDYLTPVKPGTEEIYVNPAWFRKYYDSIPFDRVSDAGTLQSDEDLEDSSGLGSGFESEEIDFDETVIDLPPAQSNCLHCGRLHPSRYQMDKRFCGDYCHIRYEETGKPGRPLTEIAVERFGETPKTEVDEDGPMVRTRRRSDEINFEETFGERRLFHETTYVPVRKEHYNACDGDSEEEIDESWRLDLLNDHVVGLGNASAAEKVLMIMWNKHMYENPLHGDRFVRYQCETFAYENGAEIQRLGLRGAFFEFIRKVIYAHGLTDAEGVASIFACLDGKKKRRTIAASRKPPTMPPPLSHKSFRGGGGMRIAPRGPRTKSSRSSKKKRSMKRGTIGGVSKGTRRPVSGGGNSSSSS